MKRASLLLLAVLAMLAACAKKAPELQAGPEFQKRLQEVLILAKPGDVIDLPAGKHALDRTLSLSVANVTLRGQGMDKTILSFSGQKTGSAGLAVTASGFTIEDIAIEDTKGDALKINGATGVVVRRVRTEWTNGPDEKNGAYGIYPVQCKNVLIEDSVAIAAADAGIYVGQSAQIIVRRNRAERNVAGIEIENSRFADVYENIATANTGGLLIFNLPDLPVKGGSHTRVFKNRVIDNNTPNFAPKGSLVANVPAGTGVMVMATHHIELFGNTIRNNATVNVSILSYLTTGNKVKDFDFDPFTGTIYVHDNVISGGGDAPGGRIAKDLVPLLGKPLPAILYDGVVDPTRVAEARICIRDNGDATFANYDAGNRSRWIRRDLQTHDCVLPPLEPVTLQGVAPAGAGRS